MKSKKGAKQMLARPIDSSGDILPVLSPSDLLSGPAAVGAGLQDHLHLFPGDWWEHPDRGNPIFDLLPLSRRTEQDAQTISSALTAYVQSFPGVQSISEVSATFSGRQFRYSATVHTEGGEAVPVAFMA